jgi:hypothetical protein
MICGRPIVAHILRFSSPDAYLMPSVDTGQHPSPIQQAEITAKLLKLNGELWCAGQNKADNIYIIDLFIF